MFGHKQVESFQNIWTVGLHLNMNLAFVELLCKKKRVRGLHKEARKK